jgi:hypothetical protein
LETALNTGLRAYALLLTCDFVSRRCFHQYILQRNYPRGLHPNYYMNYYMSRVTWQGTTQEYALYIANLIHRDTRAVIKVVRYGLNIQCWPDKHAVELVERQIAQQKRRRENEESPAD